MISQSQKVIIPVRGMTCNSCEDRLERAINRYTGIRSVKADYLTGQITVIFDPAFISLPDLENAIKREGYSTVRKTASGQPAGKAVQSMPARLAGTGLILAAIYWFVSQAGRLELFQTFPQAEAGMGYGILFIIGLMTSLHCVSMCGGIGLSQCLPAFGKGRIMAGTSPAPATQQILSAQASVTVPDMTHAWPDRSSALRPALLYNGGRVLGYTTIGALAGALGSVVTLSGRSRGLVALAAGLFMILMGLRQLDVFPWFRHLSLKLPGPVARFIRKERKINQNRPFYIGLLNALMPCGPLQAMQLFAMASGHAATGALSMFIFSLGTVPLMFGLGAISSWLNGRFSRRLVQVSALLVVVLGIGMLQNGVSLSGITWPGPVSNQARSASTLASQNIPSGVSITDGYQLITTQLGSRSYEPITVMAGIPVRWTIHAEPGTVNGCNNMLVIPEYNIEKDLVVGDNVIEFTPRKAGIVPYSCWMGMIRSRITITSPEG